MCTFRQLPSIISGKGRREFCLYYCESVPLGNMTLTVFGYQIKLTSRKVEMNINVNAVYFQEANMNHIFRIDIPRLYEASTNPERIIIDKVSSHTARKCVRLYYNMQLKTKIRVFPSHGIAVESNDGFLDSSIMDFCEVFLLKRRMHYRGPRTPPCLWNACYEEWGGIPILAVQRGLFQLLAIVHNAGEPIEHKRLCRHEFS